MFRGNLSLRKQVKNSLPNSLIKVVYASILVRLAAVADEENRKERILMLCALSIREMALNFTMESLDGSI